MIPGLGRLVFLMMYGGCLRLAEPPKPVPGLRATVIIPAFPAVLTHPDQVQVIVFTPAETGAGTPVMPFQEVKFAK